MEIFQYCYGFVINAQALFETGKSTRFANIKKVAEPGTYIS